MVFSSLTFIFVFLPLCLVTYFLSPLRWRNVILLIFSLIFYGAGEPAFLLLMLVTLVADYLFGLAIHHHKDAPKRARYILIGATIFNLALLGFFKYANFLWEILRFIPLLSTLRSLQIPLPIGISFYTFQALSYVIDVYRKEVAVQKNPVTFATYVTLFPQLVAGPIVRYQEVAQELQDRKHSAAMAAEGVRIFLVGLAKKVIYANTAGEIWQSIRADLPEGMSVAGAWLGLIAFAFQIYFDFSGYSDMAIGLGKLFGFHFPENFRYPYVCRSVTDFWRRWHITLSTWFREYVYIPLGGNRRGKRRTYVNLFVVWLLTGLWHGASLNFVLWGLYFFLLLVMEKAFLLKMLSALPRPLTLLYTLPAILFGWLIFVCDGTETGLTLIEGLSYAALLFGKGSIGFCDISAQYEWGRNLPLLVLMALAATPLPKQLLQKAKDRFPTVVYGICNLLCIPLFLLCISYLVSSGYNPFLYFRF